MCSTLLNILQCNCNIYFPTVPQRWRHIIIASIQYSVSWILCWKNYLLLPFIYVYQYYENKQQPEKRLPQAKISTFAQCFDSTVSLFNAKIIVQSCMLKFLIFQLGINAESSFSALWICFIIVLQHKLLCLVNIQWIFVEYLKRERFWILVTRASTVFKNLTIHFRLLSFLVFLSAYLRDRGSKS